MGLLIGKLVIATNENDILVRVLRSGEHKLGEVKATITPSMDIQHSLNFERLLFEASRRGHLHVNSLMTQMKVSSGFNLPEGILSTIAQDFSAGKATGADIISEIALIREEGLCLRSSFGR